MAGQFVKKEVDIEALMAQAAALEEEEKRAAASPAKKEKPPKQKKIKPPKEKKIKPEKKKKPQKKEKKNKQEGQERKIWGVPLEEIELDEDEGLPLVYVNLISVLESYACETQGLFRITASLALVDELINRYESGEDIEWGDIEDKHLLGGVLMAFLLRLPEPLITFDAYDKLINIASNTNIDKRTRYNEYRNIISKLPELNMSFLEVLIDFLDTLTRDADDNMMTASNLAICFAPGLMRRQEENLNQLMKESPLVNDIVEGIIDQYGFFFRQEGLDDCFEDEDDEDDTPPTQQLELKKFVDYTLKILENSIKRLSVIEKGLEWDKLWTMEGLQYLNVFDNLLQQAIDGTVRKLTPENIEEEKKKYTFRASSIEEARGILKPNIKQKFLAISDKQIALEENANDQKVVISVCRISKILKMLLDWIIPLIKTDEIQAESLDRTKAAELVKKLKPQLNEIKTQLDKCEIQDTAILISRIIRGVQKALKEKINSPLEEIDFNVPPSKTSSKAKIEMLQDSLEYTFPVCSKMLDGLVQQVNNPDTSDSDAMVCIAVLSQVSKTFEKYFIIVGGGNINIDAPKTSSNSNSSFKTTKPTKPNMRKAPQVLSHQNRQNPWSIYPKNKFTRN